MTLDLKFKILASIKILATGHPQVLSREAL